MSDWNFPFLDKLTVHYSQIELLFKRNLNADGFYSNATVTDGPLIRADKIIVT